MRNCFATCCKSRVDKQVKKAAQKEPDKESISLDDDYFKLVKHLKVKKVSGRDLEKSSSSDHREHQNID